jgi:hypothetical protein
MRSSRPQKARAQDDDTALQGKKIRENDRIREGKIPRKTSKFVYNVIIIKIINN